MYGRNTNNSKSFSAHDHSDEEKIRLLRDKISSLRDISIEIRTEVNDQNQYLDTVHDSMSLSGTLLKSAMKRLTQLSEMNAGAWLFSFILIAFFIFIFVHFCF